MGESNIRLIAGLEESFEVSWASSSRVVVVEDSRACIHMDRRKAKCTGD